MPFTVSKLQGEFSRYFSRLLVPVWSRKCARAFAQVRPLPSWLAQLKAE